MEQERQFISIGFNKNGEADFAVSLCGGVSLEKMNELRMIIPVAISVLEKEFTRQHQQRPTLGSGVDNIEILKQMAEREQG